MGKIRIGIVGYGNIGRGVEQSIKRNDDMELKAVFTRRDPASVKIQTEGAEVKHFDDMEAMYSKVKSGAGKYDVILVSDALMPRMIDQKLIQKLNKDNIPNISQMDNQYLNLDMDPDNNYSVPYMFGTVGLIYNKDVVKEEVNSWDILWNEKYKDQIKILLGVECNILDNKGNIDLTEKIDQYFDYVIS